MIEPVLDHAVIDARDAIDDAFARLSSAGFALTPRGRHTLGSVNHLAVFESNYLELLGWEPGPPIERLELSAYPRGLNGLVFRTDDASGLFEELRARRLPALAPLAFSRPVLLPDGGSADARFRTVRFEPGAFGRIRTYFCEHLTPELVWSAERHAHPNGAREMIALAYAGDRLPEVAEAFATLFAGDRVSFAGGAVTIEARNARIAILDAGTPKIALRGSETRAATEALGVRFEFLL